MPLEEDLHLTKDCILVARHNPWLSDNTNVAEFAATQSRGRGAQAHRARRAREGVVGGHARQRPREYLTDLTDPSDPEIGAEVAGRGLAKTTPTTGRSPISRWPN